MREGQDDPGNHRNPKNQRKDRRRNTHGRDDVAGSLEASRTVRSETERMAKRVLDYDSVNEHLKEAQ